MFHHFLSFSSWTVAIISRLRQLKTHHIEINLAKWHITFGTYVTRPRGRRGRGADVAQRRDAAPRSPRRPLGRRCTYVLLCVVKIPNHHTFASHSNSNAPEAPRPATSRDPNRNDRVQGSWAPGGTDRIRFTPWYWRN